MKAHNKIKLARQELGLKQTQLADILGVNQNDISKVESGQRKFIPNRYIEYLISKGYDINSVFNDNLPLRKTLKDDFTVDKGLHAENNRSDEKLINQVCGYIGVKNKKQLIEFLQHVDEKGKQINSNLIDMRLSFLEQSVNKEFIEKINFIHDTIQKIELGKEISATIEKLKNSETE